MWLIIDIWETVIPTYLNLTFFNFSAMFWGYEIWPGYLSKSMIGFHLFYLSCYHVMLKVSFVYFFLCFCVCKEKLCSYTRSAKVYKFDSWNSHIFTKTFCLKARIKELFISVTFYFFIFLFLFKENMPNSPENPFYPHGLA